MPYDLPSTNPENPDVPQNSLDVVMTAKDRVLQVQERFDKTQGEVMSLQSRIEQLQFIKEQLAGNTPLEATDTFTLQQMGIDPEADDLSAQVEKQLTTLTEQERAQRTVLEQTNSKLEALRKQLSPEDELAVAFDQAGRLLKKEGAGLAEIIQAIVLAYAALQKYFKYLSGELEKAVGEKTTQSTEAETVRVEGTPAEQVRALLAAEGAADAPTLRTRKIQERDALQAKIPSLENAHNTAKGKLVTAEESLKSLESRNADTEEIRTAQAAVDAARLDVDRRSGELTDAQRRFDQIKADLAAIDAALAQFDTNRTRLQDLLAKARIALPDGDIKTVVAAVDVGPSKNGIDLSLAFQEGADIEAFLNVFKKSGFSNLDAIGVNARTGEITSQAQFVAAMQQLLQRAQPEA